MSGNYRLTRKQAKAIGALLSVQTIAEAAVLIGVTERTIYRWLKLAEFQEALKAATNETIDLAIRRLVAGQGEALDSLYVLLGNAKSENVRRLASRDWMDILQRSLELSVVEKRLGELESALRGDNETGIENQT